jgi:hypothetical protein
MEELLTGDLAKPSDPSGGVWKLKAQHAEQKLEAVKAALTGLLKKI